VRAQVDAAVAHPGVSAASGRLGMILHAYQQLDLAEICYRRAHLLDPKAFEWAYYLAVVEQIHGETKLAVADARAAVKPDAASRPARMRLAESLLQAKEFKESRKLYEKLVAEEPDLALYHYGLGKVLAAQGSQNPESIPESMKDAIEQFRRACDLSPIFFRGPLCAGDGLPADQGYRTGHPAACNLPKEPQRLAAGRRADGADYSAE
jgi:tetratricopeptide (TPR) repeat protein